MKTANIPHLPRDFRTSFLLLGTAFILILPIRLGHAAGAANSAKVFASPDEAIAALRSAVTAIDTNALRTIFGPAADDLENPDRVQATNDLQRFSAALVATNRL